MSEQLGDDFALGGRLASVAIWHFNAGDVEDARRLARQALAHCRRQGLSLLDTAAPICALAWCATHDGEFERGAQLIAVFDRLVEDLPDELWTWPPNEQAVRDANIARLVDGLGLGEYEHQRKVGLELTYGEVVNLALGRTVLHS